MRLLPVYRPPATRRIVALAVALVALAGASTSSWAGDNVFRRLDHGALVVVDRPTDRTLRQLAAGGVTVVRDIGPGHIAVAAPQGLEYLDREGLSHTVVDESIEGKSY